MKILVHGSGPRSREYSEGDVDVTFAFNGRRSLTDFHSTTVEARTIRDGYGQHRIELLAERDPHGWIGELEQKINLALPHLTEQLGCIPSTGYCVIHALWSGANDVQVDGMNFDPSLVRSPSLQPRKALPQAYHNWLGERRTTYRRALIEVPSASLEWDLLNTGGKALAARFHAGPHTKPIDVFALIDAFEAAQRTGLLGPLEKVSEAVLIPDTSLLHTADSTRRLEAFCFLDRISSDTPNWWLYDERGSELCEAIVRSIRTAQGQAFAGEIPAVSIEESCQNLG